MSTDNPHVPSDTLPRTEFSTARDDDGLMSLATELYTAAHKFDEGGAVEFIALRLQLFRQQILERQLKNQLFERAVNAEAEVRRLDRRAKRAARKEAP